MSEDLTATPDQAQRPRGWPSADELDAWIEALHPELIAETRATEGDRQLALWARLVAGAAARELAEEPAEEHGRRGHGARANHDEG